MRTVYSCCLNCRADFAYEVLVDKGLRRRYCSVRCRERHLQDMHNVAADASPRRTRLANEVVLRMRGIRTGEP